jgi:hypothetical protein
MKVLEKLADKMASSHAMTFEQIILELLQGVQDGETDRFQDFFDCVEQELIYGSRETQDALIVHLLEGLKNQASLRDIDYAIFENWLGPETHVAWRWLEKKWQGKTSLADSASGL